MLTDVITVIWKELHELVLHRPNMRGGWVGLIVLLGVFGVALPLDGGPEFVQSPANFVVWAWIPYLLVGGLIADSIAGERERHTLETLLASRLPDSAILLGKVISAMLYGWGLTLASMLLSLITVNVVHGQGQLLLFPALIGLGSILVSLLVALLAAGLGVLVSLRAATVRQAQQVFNTMMLVFLLPIFLQSLIPIDLRMRIVAAVEGADYRQVLLVALLVLAVVDLVLLGLARLRFQRSRLILDV